MSFIKHSALWRCRVQLVKNEAIIVNILNTREWWKTDYDRVIFLCEKCKRYVLAMKAYDRWLGRGDDHQIVK